VPDKRVGGRRLGDHRGGGPDEFIRFASVQPHATDVGVADWQRAIYGVSAWHVALIQTPRHPIVYATGLGSGAPLLLVYE
jgi:hypothetical protein